MCSYRFVAPIAAHRVHNLNRDPPDIDSGQTGRPRRNQESQDKVARICVSCASSRDTVSKFYVTHAAIIKEGLSILFLLIVQSVYTQHNG